MLRSRRQRTLRLFPIAHELLERSDIVVVSSGRHEQTRSQTWSVLIGKEFVMLYTIAVVLLVLWLLGLVSGYTIGAFIHVLLVIAIVLFLVGMISGRRLA